MQMLITEALQQVKIIMDRVQKKRDFVLKNLAFSSQFRDPLEAQGGSTAVVTAERQAINDLEKNLVNIRIAIQKKNLEVNLTIEDETKTVAEWLVWRREVAESASAFNTRLASTLTTQRSQFEQAQLQAARQATPGTTAVQAELKVNLDVLALAQDSEKLSVTLGVLDSKLSVLNATTTIEV